MVSIKRTIKILGLLAGGLLFVSCQHGTLGEDHLKKVNSDLYPNKISRAQYHFDIAIGYRSEGVYDKAIDTFRLAILHDPQFGQAYFELAKTYVKLEIYSLAALEIDRFLQLSSPNIDEVAFITQLFIKAGSYDRAIEFQKIAYDLHKQNSFLWNKYALEMEISYFDEAERTLDVLEKNGESVFLVQMARGDNKIQQKKWFEASMAFEVADRDRPNQELTLRKWIRSLNESQNYAEAIKLSKRYFRFHVFNLHVSQQLAWAAIQSEKYDLALDELALQKKMNPWDYSIDYQMAYLFFLKKDYSDAESVYKDLYAKTESEQSLYFLAQIQVAQNNPDGASQLVQKIATTSDFYPTVQIQLARLDWKNNRRGRALNRMHESHIQRSDSIEVQREYVQLLVWEKRYVEAMALIEKVREIYTDDVPLSALAASIHFMLDNQKAFQKEIDYVLQKDPNNPEYYVMMSELWYKKNRPAHEVELLAKKAVALNSTNPNIKSLLAWSLLKQDKLTEAVQIFENLYDENPKELFFAQALAEIYSKSNLRTSTKEMVARSLDIRLNSNHLYNTYFEDVNQAAKMNAIASSDEKEVATASKASEDNEASKSTLPNLRRLPASLEVLDSPEKK